MADTKRIETFAAAVEAGDYLGAIERFYAPDVAIYENQNAQAGGRDAFLGRERATLAAFQAIKGQRVRPLVVDGDQVAIHWRFEMIPRDGETRGFEEVALQTWRGEQIVEERFFYDPSQLRQVSFFFSGSSPVAPPRRGSSSATGTQSAPESKKTCACGARSIGPSSVPSGMSVRSGWASFSQKSDVPQRRQNERLPCSDDMKRTRSSAPLSSVTAWRGTESQVT